MTNLARPRNGVLTAPLPPFDSGIIIIAKRSATARRQPLRPAATAAPQRATAAAQQGRTGEVRTPHSGYHYDGRPGRFFEGWYFKVRAACHLPVAEGRQTSRTKAGKRG